MSREFQVSVATTDDTNNSLAVLRIASAARNSVSQFYTERVQVASTCVTDLDRKVRDKLRLHAIADIQLNISIQFENDRTVTCGSPEEMSRCDFQTDSRTQLVTMKWSFIFDAVGDGKNHLHSIYVRVAERANPGLVFQKMVSGHTDDLESLDGDAFAIVSCKVDFIDSRFSSELLQVMTDWVHSLPRAEPRVAFVRWLQRHEINVSRFLRLSLPVVVLLGYIGYWLARMPLDQTSSLRIAVAWILGGSILFFGFQYVAIAVARTVEKEVDKICNVPVFNITSGDAQRMTRYSVRSTKSLAVLAISGLVWGLMKGFGLYFAALILKS